MKIIAAKNGFTVTKPDRDNDSIDAIIKCKGYPAPNCKIYSPDISVQLKASYSKISKDENENIIYPLEVKNYKELIRPNRYMPIILVLFEMYRDKTLWVEHTNEFLKITKCAYWKCLKNMPDTDNIATINITIPKENILCCETLKDILIKVSDEIEL